MEWLLGALPPPAFLTSLAVSFATTPSWVVNSSSSLVPHPSAPPPIISAAVPPHQHHPFSITHPSISPSLSSQSSPGMILSPACDPFPQTLVGRIQSGQFVDMRDLLAKSIALLNQLQSLHGPGALPPSTVNRTRLREIPSLIS